MASPATARCAIYCVAALGVRRAGIVPIGRLTSPLHQLTGRIISWETVGGGTGPCPSPRAFSSSATDARMVGVIDSEIEIAKRSDERYWMGDFPERFPFAIRDEPGTANIVLTRNYDGEKIEIIAFMPNLITGEEGEIEDDDDDHVNGPTHLSVPLKVKLSKENGPTLEFNCTAFPDEISIDSMTVREDSDPKRLVVFEQMCFSELDERVQKSFRKYLEVRGLVPANTGFLHEYMIHKDSKEYLLWLTKLKRFIET